MTRNNKATRVEMILMRAAELSTACNIPASHALIRATKELNANDDERRSVQDAFGDALVKCLPGQGTDFNRTLLEKARWIVTQKQRSQASMTVRPMDKLSASTVDAERKREMTDNDTTIETIETEKETEEVVETKTKKKGKYVKGDVHQLTSDMQLFPNGDDATIPYKFSRKVGKGNIDLAEGTDVTYDGHEQLFVDKPSTKRLIFIVPAGTPYTQDGVAGVLDEDVRVGGVPNHVDPDDEYNLNRKRRAKEAALKAKLKADAEAAAAEAKALAEAEAAEMMADDAIEAA